MSNEGQGQNLVGQHEDLVQIVNMCEPESNWWSNEGIVTNIHKGQMKVNVKFGMSTWRSSPNS